MLLNAAKVGKAWWAWMGLAGRGEEEMSGNGKLGGEGKLHMPKNLNHRENKRVKRQAKATVCRLAVVPNWQKNRKGGLFTCIHPSPEPTVLSQRTKRTCSVVKGVVVVVPHLAWLLWHGRIVVLPMHVLVVEDVVVPMVLQNKVLPVGMWQVGRAGEGCSSSSLMSSNPPRPKTTKQNA